MQTDLPDGVYLDMPFEQYLALPRLSAGGLTDLMEGPAAFWARSWMNPNRDPDDDTKAKLHGRAYHCARLEPGEFEKRFARQIVPEDFAKRRILKNGTEIGEELGRFGETKKKAGEGVLDQAYRLADLVAEMPEEERPVIWPLEEHFFAKLREKDGREVIDPKTWDEIREDARRLRMNPEVASLLEGGLPEVTILFTLDGVPCRIRPDYMAPNRIVHLKTWDSRSAGKPGNRAIVDAFAYNGHHRTGWLYHAGVLAIVDQDLEIRSSADGSALPVKDVHEAEAKALATFFQPAPVDTWFLYVRRGGVPDIRARRIVWTDLPPGVEEQSIAASTAKFAQTFTALARKADLEVRSCLKLYRESVEIFGSDPWFPRDMMGTLGDDDFSSYWLDSMDDPR